VRPDEPPTDSLRQLRRAVYRMRYWVCGITGPALCLNAVNIERTGLWGLMPSNLFAALAIGAAWTTAGWLRGD
jgi:hypothetical protein